MKKAVADGPDTPQTPMPLVGRPRARSLSTGSAHDVAAPASAAAAAAAPPPLASPADALPDELLSRVAACLTARDLLAGAELACARWRRALGDDELAWRPLCARLLVPALVEPPAGGLAPALAAPPGARPRPWRAVYGRAVSGGADRWLPRDEPHAWHSALEADDLPGVVAATLTVWEPPAGASMMSDFGAAGVTRFRSTTVSRAGAGVRVLFADAQLYALADHADELDAALTIELGERAAPVIVSLPHALAQHSWEHSTLSDSPRLHVCFHRETVLAAVVAAVVVGAHDSALLRRVAAFVHRQRLLAQPPPPVLVREAARRARWRVLVDTARRAQHLNGIDSPRPVEATPLCAALAVSIELFSHQYPPRRFGAPWASVCELRIDALHVNVDDDLRLVWTYFLDDELQMPGGIPGGMPGDPPLSEFELESVNLVLFWGRHWPIWAGSMTPDLDDGTTKEFFPFCSNEASKFVIATSPNGLKATLTLRLSLFRGLVVSGAAGGCFAQ